MISLRSSRNRSKVGVSVAVVLFIVVLLLPACGLQSPVTSFQPNISVGGRAVSIAVHPTDASQILVASESGGLFRSKDGGKTWAHIPGLAIFPVGDVAYAPLDAKIVIATVRAGFLAKINPIWRSTDGGDSWSVPATSAPAAGPRCSARPSGHGLSFEAGTANVYAGTDCGLAVSHDNGLTWTHVALNPAVPPTAERRQNRVWSVLAQSGGRLNVAADDGLWYSPDGGANWHKSTSGPAAAQGGVIHAFAASPFNSAHLLLAGPPGGAGEYTAIYSSTDSGATWVKDWPIKVWGRPVFVRAAESVSGAENAFDAYAGNGVNLFRRTYTSAADGTLTGSGSWSQLTVDHADPCDIAFNLADEPLLLATDGGLHTTKDKGATWTLTGGGVGGYNALQIFQMTGQEVGGSSPHLDLYFGTQDNYLWASSDGGKTWPYSIGAEGDLIRTSPASVNHVGVKVTGVAGSANTNFLSDAHFANNTGWPNVTDSIGAPFPLGQPGHYFQWTKHGWTPPWKGIAITKNYGQSWWEPYVGVEENLVGPPIIVGPSNDPVVYQAVRRPGATVDGFERIGLVRISNLYGLGDVVLANADGNGVISLGQYSSMFFWGPVIGVNPDWPDDLIVADVGTHQMRESWDGGKTWTYGLYNMTDAVTDNGRFVFEINEPVPSPKGALMTARQIVFDPSASDCHILIGTRGNGVIRTANGGVDWSRIPDSDAMGDVSSLYFPLGGNSIYASTYGRGLWRLTLDRPKTCGLPPGPKKTPDPELIKKISLHDFQADTTSGFRFGAPLECEHCELLLAKDGQITDLELEGALIRQVTISGGSVHQFDARGGPLPLSVPSLYRSGLGRFSGHEQIAAIVAEHLPIRGLLLDRGALRGVITSEGELPDVPGRSPYIRVTSDPSAGGFTTVGRGEEVMIEGDGFVAGSEGESGLTISIDGELIARGLAVDETGHFRFVFTVDRPVADYQVVAEQQAGYHFLRDATVIHVVIRD